MEDKKILLDNIDKIHTTEMGVDKVYQQLIRSQYPLFRKMMLNKYESNGELIEQKEFLVQDPDGYLLRFTHE